VIPVQADRAEYEGFLKIKAVAELMDGMRELAMDPITPPYENRFRLVPANDDDPYAPPAAYAPPPVADVEATEQDAAPPWVTPGGTADIPAEVMADETAAAADPEDMN
jgi:hypothetical protein